MSKSGKKLIKAAREAEMDKIWSCFCVGPQNGEPRCPCQMRNVTVRDGRYIQKEIDLGPVRDTISNLYSLARRG